MEDTKLSDALFMSAYFISILSVLLMLEGRIRDRLIYTLGLFSIFTCLDELIGVVLTDLLSSLAYKSIVECIVSIILFAIILFFQKIEVKIHIKMIWFTTFTVLSCVCLAFTISTFTDIKYIQKFSGKMIYSIMILIGYGCLVGMIAVALYMKELNQREQELLKMEKCINEMQKKYYLSLLERESDTRRYRHDINNHFMCLREMVSGNAEVENYIDKLQEQLCDIKRKKYETGLEILNILLSNHLSEIAEDISISIVGKVKAQPDINTVDFCIIFSNLLSNAVEEVKRMACADSYIKIEIKTGKYYLMITIKNSSKTCIENEERIMTKKADRRNHGIGLRNVRDTIEKNKGNFFLEGNGKEVSAKVILNLKTDRKKSYMTVDGVILENIENY